MQSRIGRLFDGEDNMHGGATVLSLLDSSNERILEQFLEKYGVTDSDQNTRWLSATEIVYGGRYREAKGPDALGVDEKLIAQPDIATRLLDPATSKAIADWMEEEGQPLVPTFIDNQLKAVKDKKCYFAGKERDVLRSAYRVLRQAETRFHLWSCSDPEPDDTFSVFVPAWETHREAFLRLLESLPANVTDKRATKPPRELVPPEVVAKIAAKPAEAQSSEPPVPRSGKRAATKSLPSPSPTRAKRK